MDPPDLNSLVEAVPDVRDLMEDPRLLQALERIGLDLGPESWDFCDRVDLVTRLIALTTRQALRSLEKRVVELASWADAVSGARQRWAFFGWIRGEVVFASGAGELAAMPIELAWRIHSRGRVDAELREEPDFVLFLSGGEVVARLPRALFPGLLDLLNSVPWDRAKSRLPNSHSHESHEIPSGNAGGTG